MTAVFVHGVPETGALWNSLRSWLRVPSIALDLPGFGAPRPEGFGATKDDYAEWLAGELRRIGEPVDLVGHDWGAALVGRVATAYDVPLRSWAVDLVEGAHEDYAWHDLARVWQTPGDGERQVAATLADGAGLVESTTGLGMRRADAEVLRSAYSETMGRSILDLYRSALPNVAADWGDGFTRPTAAPGLIVLAGGDPFGDPPRSRELAARLGARTAELPGLGHWWMSEDPGAGADLLQRFWSSL
ncbi:alpha/beta fold hydrolase [Umezawaea beigongshangensis]|uniref:alpha/beta fold hydrolase n=1 Tax=Umezawaea beigongshangensis TaxID=2780383 RepID=UPI0018F1FCC0|nr:alpha/beta hydrolase [Umezawaea beigongshangensis]